MSKHQYAAILMARRLGAQLANEHPELKDQYLNPDEQFTPSSIVRMLLPSENVTSDDLASSIVSHTLRVLFLNDDRLYEMRRIRRSQLSKAIVAALPPEKWSARCRKANAQRYKKNIPVDVTAMLSARGRKQWSPEENSVLLSLLVDTSFKHDTPKKGRDYGKIATALNDRFHGGELVRGAVSCRSHIADIRKNQKQPRIRKAVVI